MAEWMGLGAWLGTIIVAMLANRQVRRLAEENGALRVNNAQLMATLKQFTERAKAAREPIIARPTLVVPGLERKPS